VRTLEGSYFKTYHNLFLRYPLHPSFWQSPFHSTRR
jgi:hypothetical protein